MRSPFLDDEQEIGACRPRVRETRGVKRALAISAGLHVVLGAALLSVELSDGDNGTADIAQPIAIEIIAPVRETPPLDVEGGGSFRSPEPAPTTSTSKSIATPTATSAAPSSARRTSANANRRAASTTDNPFGDVDRALHPVATTTSTGGSDRDGDGGEGFGTGGERGDGIGFGNGGRIAVAEEQLTMPPPPKADVPSKARPAKLIYPSRERDLGKDKLFVARITVDTDGYVVGARLVKGRNGPRD